MDQTLKRNKDFILDLAFTCSEEALSWKDLDSLSKSFLIDSNVWQLELKNWLQTIRDDIRICCPDSVRNASLVSMGLQFTDDSKIIELNSKWRSRNETTDVLSFPVIDENIFTEELKCIEIGDIFVSIPTAKRQSLEFNHQFMHELRWLVSHGLLHLLGWEHPNQDRLNEMLTFQSDLLLMSNISRKRQSC